MAGTPQLSVVVPVHDEAGNIAPLVREIVDALRGVVSFELVYVDDASRDASASELQALKADVPELRVLRHETQAGQSVAIRNGVKAARAPWVATLDGDGQNDPADLPKLLAARDAAAAEVKLLTGWRVARKDTAAKRWASRAASSLGMSAGSFWPSPSRVAIQAPRAAFTPVRMAVLWPLCARWRSTRSSGTVAIRPRKTSKESSFDASST